MSGFSCPLGLLAALYFSQFIKRLVTTRGLLVNGGQIEGPTFYVKIKLLYTKYEIPDEWCSSIAILMFKKGDKKIPSNYRSINLLNTTLKLTTKILTNIINSMITVSDEKQGFRTGRSCTDAVFVMRQIMKKSIEYNRPAYLYFIDLKR